MPPKTKKQKGLLTPRVNISTFFSPETPVTVDKNNNRDVQGLVSASSETLSENDNTVTDENKPPRKANLNFQSKWLKTYPWLRYDDSSPVSVMFCELCKQAKYTNTLALGTSNFKTTTLTRHIDHADHRNALKLPTERNNFTSAVAAADSKECLAITLCMKVVYWLAKESIPLSKYSTLMDLLDNLQTPNMDALLIGKNVNYTSYNTATDILSALSESIDTTVSRRLKSSPVITIMTDESTDITVHHKLCISARIVEPSTLAPSTLFLTDLRITSATGVEIFKAIQTHLEGRNINISMVTGLGTDGASVMTGRKTGLTGQFLRHNPHIVNTHCSAHRIALCSEQAATGIPAMQYYQQVLESIYYHFKKSPLKSDGVEAVQKLINDPKLKYKEVHQVRWLSFYQALETVFRTMDSLLTFFSSTAASDPKAKGLGKKISEDFFIYTTYSMMDVLVPVMKLNLFFQKKDVDIGCVQMSVENCVSELEMLKAASSDSDATPHLNELSKDLIDGVFKGQHTVKVSKYKAVVARQQFIQALIDNITKRFPDKQIMTSFCVLGLRPLAILSDDELKVWGNEQIEVLVDFFGKKQSHSSVDGKIESEPVVDGARTMEEWKSLKTVVKTQGYPVTSTANLWQLISAHHSDEFENLTKLAALALTHPVHTSDCERAFSAQNSVTTPLRNRLSPDHCDALMRIMIEGESLQLFDFQSAFQKWKAVKARKIMSTV